MTSLFLGAADERRPSRNHGRTGTITFPIRRQKVSVKRDANRQTSRRQHMHISRIAYLMLASHPPKLLILLVELTRVERATS
jgi:hypothetical protein